MNMMDRHDHQTGRETAAVRVMVPGKCLAHHAAACCNEDDEEGAVQLREQTPPLLVGVLEVGESLQEAVFLLREEGRQLDPYGLRFLRAGRLRVRHLRSPLGGDRLGFLRELREVVQ